MRTYTSNLIITLTVLVNIRAPIIIMAYDILSLIRTMVYLLTGLNEDTRIR